MTLEKRMLHELQSRGLWEDQAKEILEIYKRSDLAESMTNRWNDDVDVYPASVIVGV